MSSCSGPKAGTVIGGGGRNGTVNIVLTTKAFPGSAPSTISVLSFTVAIGSISITSSSSKVSTITPTNPTVDLNKLLSDSTYLGQTTSDSNILTGMEIHINNASVVYCTATAGVPGCNPGSIQTVTLTGTTVVNNAAPTFPITDLNLGMQIGFNLKNALVLNAGGTAVTAIDFTQALTTQVEAIGEGNLTSPQIEWIEDVTGVVTAASPTQVTLSSTTAGAFTGNIVTGTSNLVRAPAVGQVADMDLILNNDGTFTTQVFDQIDTTSNDWIEGVIGYAPTALNQFQIITTNYVPATTGSHLGTNLHLGTPVTVTISPGTSFTVDAKSLTVTTGDNFTSATDTSVMAPGQVVAIRATAFTGPNGTTPATATANAVTLRYTRVTGQPGAGGNNFQFLPIGPYLGIQNLATTFETTGATNYDVPGGGTSATANIVAAIRALYFTSTSGATFYIAKVRQ